MRREGLFYAACARRPEWSEAAALLPRLRHFSAAEPLLVCELLPEARELFERYRLSGEPAEAARALGRALGRVHHLFRRRRAALARELPELQRGPPLGLRIHRPPLWIRRVLFPAQEELLRRLQNAAGLVRALELWQGRWRDQTLIHGDIRSENVLFAGAPERLCLIDWELLQWGDPAWDLGAALAAHLEYGLERGALPALAEANRELLVAYLAAAAPPRRGRPALLRRAAAFTAVQLLQLAWIACRREGQPPEKGESLLELARTLLEDRKNPGRRLPGLEDAAILAGDG